MNPSRRDLLVAMLGAPAALAACRRHRSARYDVALAGPDERAGHRLRSAQDLFAQPVDARRTVSVLVVGAGAAGLASAWRLRREGFEDLAVLDLEAVEGGTSMAGQNSVSAYPRGAHYVPVPSAGDRALVALLREMSVVTGFDALGEPVVDEASLVRDLDERVFDGERWHEGLVPRATMTALDREQWPRWQRELDAWVARRDARGRHAFTLPARAGSDEADVAALDRISMREWLDAHGFTAPALRWLVRYACRDDYGCEPENTSAWAGLFYFASRVPAPGRPPAELIAWPEGNARLTTHLARGLGDRLQTRELVFDVSPCAGGLVKVRSWNTREGRVTEWTAQHAIVAVPGFVARRIVAPWRERAPQGIERFTYAPWAVVNLTLRGRPREHGVGMAWDNVIRDSESLGYVCATHQSLRDHGSTVLTWYYPLTGASPERERRRMQSLGARDWADLAVSDLSVPHPELGDLVTRAEVMRWAHGMVRPVPGFVSDSARRRAAEPIDGRVFFAHTDRSAMALFEEALACGVSAAEAVLGARGTAPDERLGADVGHP